MTKTECVIAVSSSSSPACPSSPLPCLFVTKFTPLLLLQDSGVPICTLSCSSTQVPPEIWGHVRSSRDGHPTPMPPGLPSRDLYRRNEGRTHRMQPQDCYRRRTDATDIPTFLRMGEEGRRERQEAEISAFWGQHWPLTLTPRCNCSDEWKESSEKPALTVAATSASHLKEPDWKQFFVILHFLALTWLKTLVYA